MLVCVRVPSMPSSGCKGPKVWKFLCSTCPFERCQVAPENLCVWKMNNPLLFGGRATLGVQKGNTLGIQWDVWSTWLNTSAFCRRLRGVSILLNLFRLFQFLKVFHNGSAIKLANTPAKIERGYPKSPQLERNLPSETIISVNPCETSRVYPVSPALAIHHVRLVFHGKICEQQDSIRWEDYARMAGNVQKATLPKQPWLYSKSQK